MAPLQRITFDVGLDAAGIVALADLATVQQRTALTGTAVLLDALVLCPGIHMQQRAPELNLGEYPACAALNSGYVFRIENSAMVYYLQQVGKTGHLTTLSVSPPINEGSLFSTILSAVFPCYNTTLKSSLAYGSTILLTVTITTLIGLSEDWWGIAVVALLILSRFCNFVVVYRRSKPGWAGASEPGKHGDLIVLLSQDRWIRIRGAVDDIKLVTSGQWLRDQTRTESWATALATVIVYLDDMHGRIVSVQGARKKYERRLELAEELIGEMGGRDDWAVRLGMIVEDDRRRNDPVRATM